ncbi:MAG TPA: ATP-dependent Clp protease proteolytic subunit [Firmicutes bacterium]|nr:ATP-dependent Clp protease proteolytic subunit [Bacillota bacterium]
MEVNAEFEPEFKEDSKFYEILTRTRSIIISGEINQKVAERVLRQLLYLQELSTDPIKVFLNTQGGHVESGDTIYDMFKFVKPEIIVIGSGWVASAGITIYLGAKKENRYSLPNTRYLIHQPSGGVRGQATDIQIEAAEIVKTRKRINELISRETGQPLENVERDTERNFWMSAEEAQKYGIVSKIITNISELKI